MEFVDRLYFGHVYNKLVSTDQRLLLYKLKSTQKEEEGTTFVQNR